MKIKKSNLVGTLKLNQIKWTIRKNRKISNTYNLGDIIFVKKINKNWKIKQYPKVNGGIVALDPFTGDVKALVGDLILNQVNLIVLLRQKDNQDQLLNQ